VYSRRSGTSAREALVVTQSVIDHLMPPKRVVSFPIEPAMLAEINAEIDAAREAGIETDFSKWMRDAVRRKLKRSGRTAEKSGDYGRKRK
jgi:hypothetical protein